MKILNAVTAVFVAAFLLISSIATAADANTPEETVLAFNEAIAKRDTAAIQAALAEGSVQIQLRPAHPGMPEDPPLTGDLKKTWEVVAAILFPSTESYIREIDVTQSYSDGEVATVWVNTTTHTQRKQVAESMVLTFSEVYMLVKKDNQWKIAVIADNRAPDNIVVGAETGD